MMPLKASPIMYTRRRLLKALSVGGAVCITGAPQVLAAAEALETTTVRLPNDHNICIAPEYVAEELLRADGFTDIRYVDAAGNRQLDALLRGEIDFSNFSPGGRSMMLIEAGTPI